MENIRKRISIKCGQTRTKHNRMAKIKSVRRKSNIITFFWVHYSTYWLPVPVQSYKSLIFILFFIFILYFSPLIFISFALHLLLFSLCAVWNYMSLLDRSLHLNFAGFSFGHSFHFPIYRIWFWISIFCSVFSIQGSPFKTFLICTVQPNATSEITYNRRFTA